jgi:HEAT repeat protein
MIVASGSMPSKSLSRVGRALVAACLIILPLAPVRGEAPPSAATQPATVTAAENDAARRAVQALLAAARDPNQEVQQAAMQAVARFGPAAIPTLVESLDMSPSGDMAVSLLASLGEQAVDPLLKTLESKDPARRLRALQAIDGMITQQVQMGYGMPGFGGAVGGEMMLMEGAGGMPLPGGEGAPPEVKKLTSRVCGPVANRAGDEDASVRLQAVTMLGRLSSLCAEESIAKATVRALNDQSVEVRRAAAVTMVNLGGAAREEALEALTTAVKDDDEQVRVAALDALGAMGPAAKGASEVIIGALKDPQPRVRVAAARALGAMQPRPEPPPPPPGGMAPYGGGFGGPQAPYGGGFGGQR